MLVVLGVLAPLTVLDLRDVIVILYLLVWLKVVEVAVLLRVQVALAAHTQAMVVVMAAKVVTNAVEAVAVAVARVDILVTVVLVVKAMAHHAVRLV